MKPKAKIAGHIIASVVVLSALFLSFRLGQHAVYMRWFLNNYSDQYPAIRRSLDSIKSTVDSTNKNVMSEVSRINAALQECEDTMKGRK